MKPKLQFGRLVAAAVGSVAVGWGLAGWWAALNRVDTTRAEAGPAKPNRLAAFGNGGLDASLAAVAAAGAADAQMAAAVALATRIDPKNFAAFLDNLRFLPAHSAQGLASRTVLRRWTASDPGAALQWCATHDRELIAGVIDEWARNTPPNQAVFLLDRIPAAHRAQAIPSIFNVLAADNPEAAMELLALPEAAQSMHRFARALDKLALRDPNWVLDRAETLPDQLRLRVRSAAVLAMVETGGSEAWSRVMAQPDRNDLLANLAENSKHIPAILAALAELPREEQAKQYLSLHNMGRGESAAFVDAIVAHHAQFCEHLLRNVLTQASNSLARADSPGFFADQLLALDVGNAFNVANFVTCWARRSPEEARAWADTLTDETKRREAIEAVDTASRPPDEPSPVSLAKKLAEQIGLGDLPEPQRLLALAEDERRQVLDVGFGRILEGQKTHPFSHSWQTLSLSYPAEAARWLAESVTAENVADFLQPLTTTASCWAADNPPAAARWAMALPAGQSRAWAAANVVDQWRLIDESAARAWIQSLPPDERPIASEGFDGAGSVW